MLSIITPVFNSEAYIQSCISNIIQQNCPNVEHIIVDGGSDDHTVDIIKTFANRYTHIRSISEKDNGQSDAMNKGIQMAKGEIIGFLNADDFYEPDTLNRILEIFRGLPEPSLLVGNCNVWNEKGTLLYINKPSKLHLKEILSGNPFPVNPSSYFYHKSLHAKIGNFETLEEYAMDIDFLLRAVQVAHVMYINEVWGNFLFCEGTKTYEDMQNDLAFKRLKKLFQKYRENLDPVSRFQVRIFFRIFELGRSCIRTLRLLHIYPEKFSQYIRH
ncbi:MAG: glycosyltransferase [Methanoregula sp.]|nr:glycosyltransferase [Methanoregula sp.]